MPNEVAAPLLQPHSGPPLKDERLAMLRDRGVGNDLKVVSGYEPAGDQPQAIDELVAGIEAGEKDQVLLGVTGSGKTFTMAHTIQRLQRPALILAPNKTLAAQLYGEMRGFFPENAVEYFVSYYDYYQPEAYVPRTDTYVEKEAQVNEQIDRMRHSATRSILERDDVVVVASVSCIYGIGSIETYSEMIVRVKTGQTLDRSKLPEAAGGAAVQPQRHQLPPRHLPGARRRRRDLPRPPGRPRLAALAVRRRTRIDHRVRPADRREDERAGGHRRLRQQPLCDAEANAAAGDQGHQGGAESSAWRSSPSRASS